MERLVLWQRLVAGVREEDRDPKVELAWVKRVVARVAAEGGDTVAIVGGSVVASFDVSDLTTAIDLCIALVEEAERDDDPSSSIRLAIAIAMGPTHVEESPVGKHVFRVGAPFDRAQLLANRARVGEVVVDGPTRDACGNAYLFHRLVGSGESALRGHAIDRTVPRLDACRANLALLAPLPIPPAFEPAWRALRDTAASTGTQIVVTRGSSDSGARQLIEQVAGALTPSLVLRVPPSPGGHEPLGGLRAALAGTFGGIGGLDAIATSLDAASSEALRGIARGEVIAMPAAIDAMVSLFEATRGDGAKPWIILDPPMSVDTSTLQLVGELAEGSGLELLIVARARGEAKLPATLSRGTEIRELVVPALGANGARALAEHVLGSVADGDLARRIVALSGEGALAVLETIRWLVSVGDVVTSPRGFRFRVGPRLATKALTLDALYTERIGALDPETLRLLEVIATIPCGFGDELIANVALMDGLGAKSVAASREVLAALALPTDAEEIATTETLRSAVLRHMPPSRSSELARFVADALERSPRTTEGFLGATYAHYLAEGGQPVKAAAALITAATRAAAHQHARAAIRLAASAVELDPSSDTRDASSRILGSVSSKSRRAPPQSSNDMSTLPPPSRDNDASGKLSSDAIGALRARDFERVERCLDTAIAQGGSLVAAERLRALAYLSRGDRRAATISLGRARGFAGDDVGERARNGLLDAWLSIAQGMYREALRSALLSLAGARTSDDAHGERAAMRTAAVCLDLLGREDDARMLRSGAA